MRSRNASAIFVVLFLSVTLFSNFLSASTNAGAFSASSSLDSPAITTLATNTSAVTEPAPVSDQRGKPLRIATKPIEPFVFEAPVLRGFSIELMSDLARRLDRPVEFVRYKKVTELLNAVREKNVDAGIAAISITAEREVNVDFTLPMFDSGLQILARPTKSNGFAESVRSLFSPTVLKFLGFMLFAMLLAGLVSFLSDRLDDDHRFSTFADAAYTAAVQLVTVSSAEKQPKRNISKFLAVLWMLFGLFLVAQFTAILASSLTVKTLRSDIRTVEDLQGRKVLSIADTTSQRVLNLKGILNVGAPTFKDAIDLLGKGRADALVFDSPVIRYYLSKGDRRFILSGAKFNSEFYGIAVPAGSGLRDELNAALLAAREDGSYDEMVTRWFGDE